MTCIGTDETSVAATVNSGITYNYITKTATLTAPAEGKAYLFESVVVDPSNRSYSATFGLFTPIGGVGGSRVLAAGMTLEPDAEFGWIKAFNEVVRNGGGGTAETPLTEAGAGPFNDYDMGTSTFMEFTGGASVTVNGILAPAGGVTKRVTLIADDGFTLTLNDQNAGSSAANRLELLGLGASVVCNAATFIYSVNRSRWCVEAYTI
jgi:hypothetical protein